MSMQYLQKLTNELILRKRKFETRNNSYAEKDFLCLMYYLFYPCNSACKVKPMSQCLKADERILKK